MFALDHRADFTGEKKKKVSHKIRLSLLTQNKISARPGGCSQALPPHWIIYGSVCACSNETQQLHKLQLLVDQDPPQSSGVAPDQLASEQVMCVNISVCLSFKVTTWDKFRHAVTMWTHSRYNMYYIHCYSPVRSSGLCFLMSRGLE